MTRFQQNTIDEIRMRGPLTIATSNNLVDALDEMVRIGLLVKEMLVTGFIRYSECEDVEMPDIL